jgi:mRNA interferase MazF
MGLMQRISKGEIYLANLGDKRRKDIGKIRPVLIFQNDMLNRMVHDAGYRDVIVIPLSSRIVQNDYSLFLKRRDRLEKDSVILCNTIKMINAERLLTDRGILTTLTMPETEAIEKILFGLLGCGQRQAVML